MSMLKDRDRKTLTKIFEELKDQVKLVMFTQEIECEYCHLTREMMEEIASLSDKISVKVYDFIVDSSAARGTAMNDLMTSILSALILSFRPRLALQAEILALRHQLKCSKDGRMPGYNCGSQTVSFGSGSRVFGTIGVRLFCS